MSLKVESVILVLFKGVLCQGVKVCGFLLIKVTEIKIKIGLFDTRAF